MTKTFVTLDQATADLTTAEELVQLAHSSRSGADGIHWSCGVEDTSGRPPGPLEREERDGVGNRVGPKAERCHDAEVPATSAAAGPIQVRAVSSRRCRLRITPSAARSSHRRRLVAREAVGVEHHPMPPPSAKIGDADGGAGAARQQEIGACAASEL